MRLNPFTMWWDTRKQNRQIMAMAKQVGEDMRELLEQVAKHQAETAHELFKLKNPWYERSQATVDEPLTEEQEKIVKEFFENSNLPEQIRRNFASVGPVGMRATLGRLGEAPSEQTRSTDAVHPVKSGDVNATIQVINEVFDNPDYAALRKKIAEMPLSRKMANYPGNCYRYPHLAIPPRNTATGFRDPQPPPRQKSMDELISEEQRVMDREAWDNMDLEDIPAPKE